MAEGGPRPSGSGVKKRTKSEDSAKFNDERMKNFVRILQHLEEAHDLTPEFWQVIPNIPLTHTQREEEPLPDWSQRPLRYQELLERDPGQRFTSLAAGLLHFGWSEIPWSRQHLGSGAFGRVSLAFSISDPRPIEQKKFAAVKKQSLETTSLLIWKEINYLRAVSHPNIVDYFGHFFVIPDANSTQEELREGNRAAILMEFANAGDLRKELNRFPDLMMPEEYARYYVLQVCEAVEYLHEKGICHCDIKLDNVLLRYNTDYSKWALLADFGIAEPVSVREKEHPYPLRIDVMEVKNLVGDLLRGPESWMYRPEQFAGMGHSKESFQLIDDRNIPPDIPTLLQHPWFKGPAKPHYANETDARQKPFVEATERPDVKKEELLAKLEKTGVRRKTHITFDPRNPRDTQSVSFGKQVAEKPHTPFKRSESPLVAGPSGQTGKSLFRQKTKSTKSDPGSTPVAGTSSSKSSSRPKSIDRMLSPPLKPVTVTSGRTSRDSRGIELTPISEHQATQESTASVPSNNVQRSMRHRITNFFRSARDRLTSCFGRRRHE